MKFDLTKLKKIVGELGSSTRNLANQIEAAKIEREHLLTAPPTREAMLESRLDYIGECEKRFEANLVRDCEVRKNKPFWHCMRTVKGGIGHHHFVSSSWSGKVDQMLIVGALSVPIREAVKAAIQSMPWPDKECGPSTKERERQIKALDTKITTLESELSELRDEAHRAKVRL